MARTPPPRIHDDNPDPAGRGDRREIRRAPISGEVVAGRGQRRAETDDDHEGPSAADLERFGDVTRRCPECRKDVYDESAVCYHCGHAFRSTTAGSPTKSGLWVVLTVVVLVVLLLMGALGGVF
jgi:hypothetical protein